MVTNSIQGPNKWTEVVREREDKNPSGTHCCHLPRAQHHIIDTILFRYISFKSSLLKVYVNTWFEWPGSLQNIKYVYTDGSSWFARRTFPSRPFVFSQPRKTLLKTKLVLHSHSAQKEISPACQSVRKPPQCFNLDLSKHSPHSYLSLWSLFEWVRWRK